MNVWECFEPDALTNLAALAASFAVDIKDERERTEDTVLYEGSSTVFVHHILPIRIAFSVLGGTSRVTPATRWNG